MEWLNYHHLLYFYTVVREGGLAPAAARLRVSHPTISAQLRTLEEHLGEKLLVKQGRRLVLTEMGRVVYGYAEEIFSIGNELLDTVRGRPTGRRPRLVVGIVDVVPKLIARHVLEPVRRSGDRVRLLCREDSNESLLTALSEHRVDVVLSDAPLPPGSAVRAYGHLLGECGISICGTRPLAAKYKRGFPKSLDGAPFLLPSELTAMRRSLDHWLDAQGVRPDVEAEFDDSALMKVFGQDGAGLFPIPTAIEGLVCKQFGVSLVGRIHEVRERYYVISPERRLRNPAVLLITTGARESLFANTSMPSRS